MGFDAACAAIYDALVADATLAAVAIKPNPVAQINADLTLMVYPLECQWSSFTMEEYQGSGDIRIALHKRASSTEAGGIATDIAALRPYVDSIPRALATAWNADNFADTVANVGAADTPWLRSERPSPDSVNGLDTVSLRFALNVTPNEEAF